MNALNHSAYSSSTVISGPWNSLPAAAAQAEPVEIAAPVEPVKLPPATAMVERAALTKAFDVVKRTVEARSCIPVLSNAKLAAVDGALVVSGTNLEMEIRATVPGAIDAHFAMTADCRLVESFLKKAAACDLVGFSMREESALIEFEKVKYNVLTIDAADYPELAPVEFSHRFPMPGKALWDMIDGVCNAISKEETRYYLNGIFCHVYQNGNRHEFRMVATDGHRLQRQEIEAHDGALGMPGVIMPRAMCDLLWSLIKGKACPDMVEIAVHDTRISVKFDNIEIVSKTIDGSFPDYMRVIPTGNTKAMEFKRADMVEALNSVALVSSEKGRAVRFNIANGKCVLTVSNPDSGSAESTIDCQWTERADLERESLEVGVNYAYLLGALADAGGDRVTMLFNDAGSPMLINSEREGWMAVLMPMRV